MSRIISGLAGLARGALDRARLMPVDRLFLRGVITATASVAGPIAGATSAVAGRELGYQAERWATNHIPDVANAVKAMWAGELTVAGCAEVLRNHGIKLDLLAGPEDNKWVYYWQQIIRHQRPRITNEQALDLWRQNSITTAECRAVLSWHGLTYPGERELLMRNRGWFDLGTATDLWRQGLMTDIEYGSAMDRAGIGEVDARNLLLTQRGLAPLGEYVGWWLQGTVTDDGLADRLARDGITTPDEVGRYLDQRRRIPEDIVIDRYHAGQLDWPAARASIQRYGWTEQAAYALAHRDAPLSRPEALTWLIRSEGNQQGEWIAALKAGEITDPQRQALALQASLPLPTVVQAANMARSGALDEDLAARWQLDAGMPQQYVDVATWQGYGDRPRQLGQPPEASTWPTLASAYWRGSVTLLTPSDALAAHRRFTAGQLPRYIGVVPDLIPFTADDLAATYRAHGYSPVTAAWHQALALPEIPARTILQLYRYDPQQWPRVERALRRRGYLAEDIQAYRDIADARQAYQDGAFARSKLHAALEASYKAVERGYKAGLYSEAQALEALLPLGIAGAPANQLLFGWQAEVNQTYVSDALKRLRHGYFAGEFSAAEVQALLASLQLQPAAVTRTLSAWVIQRTWTRRAASSAQILKWVGSGLLQPAVGAARLANLGWTAPDIALELAEAQSRLAHATATAAAGAQRTKRQAQAALARSLKQHQSAITATQAAMRRLTPKGELRKWLAQGLVSKGWVAERLALMGYVQPEIGLMIDSWQQAKPAKAAQPMPPPPEPPPQ